MSHGENCIPCGWIYYYARVLAASLLNASSLAANITIAKTYKLHRCFMFLLFISRHKQAEKGSCKLRQCEDKRFFVSADIYSATQELLLLPLLHENADIFFLMQYLGFLQTLKGTAVGKKTNKQLDTFVIYVNEKQVTQTEHAKTNRRVRESTKNKRLCLSAW